MEKVAIGKYELSGPEFENVSAEAKQLIKRMMCFDPKKRISASDALKEVWFKDTLQRQDEGINLNTLGNLKRLTVSFFVYLVPKQASTGGLLLYCN